MKTLYSAVSATVLVAQLIALPAAAQDRPEQPERARSETCPEPLPGGRPPAASDCAERSTEPAPAPRQPVVVVTANRLDQPVDAVLASVTVLDRDAIEASQAADLIDLLGRQVGITIARTGGPGSASTVFMRGANSNQTLILIDGVRVNATGQGLFDLAHLAPDQIERIEIVRGPRAAQWGSDAIGGVIHIVTRDLHGPNASLRGGRWGRAEAHAGVSSQGEAHGVSVAAGYRRLTGFSATDASAFGHDPDADGYWQRHGSARGRVALANHTAEAALFASDADVEFDQGRTDARTLSGAFALDGTLAAGWQHRIGYGHAREDLDTPAFDSRFESRRDSLDWLHTVTAEHSTWLLGLSWQRESGRSLSSFAGPIIDRNRDNRAGFVSGFGQFGTIEWQAALRLDDNSQFGDATTGSLAVGHALGRHGRVRASWGEGFRAPNFNELYSPGFGGLFAGNPTLAPERARSLELAVEWALGSGEIEVAAFDTQVRDQIAFDGPLFAAVNIDRSRAQGIEISHDWHGRNWSSRTALTIQDVYDRDTGLALLRRPDHQFDSAIDWHANDHWRFGVDVQVLSERRDFDRVLGGFARVDLRAEWRPDPIWTVQARIENLGDRDYRLASGFQTPGRNLLVTLIWQPSADSER